LGTAPRPRPPLRNPIIPRFRRTSAKGEVMAKVKELHVNGAARAIDAEGDRSLLGVLRDDLGLTGPKYGCGEGQCGACTVLLDGARVRSCVTRLDVAAGKKVQTIEGLADGDKLHPVQEAFLEAGAFQCGYCTPGMVLSAVALLNRQAEPSRDDIVRFMDKNVCRCGTYVRIVAAVQEAAKRMKGGDK
jgi:aerobic-type carbon monoxide dehydrogenase small subunit (CoxS/CutS family)